MRVAVVHYWLVGMRGGEKVLEEICTLFPDADVFTHVYDPSAVSDRLRAHRVTTSFISRLPMPRRAYKAYLPFMPLALEALDLRGYDLVISSESGPAKGVICSPDALHVCYCHSPMRYIWNMYHEYFGTTRGLARWMMPLVAHYMRIWDAATAARVHHFVANSRCVRDRIRSYYGRTATVIAPPVAVLDFRPVAPAEVDDYFLMVGELVSYKRADLAIEAFNRMGRRLVVIGGGEGLKAAKRAAGPTVEILGPQPFDKLRWHYARCRALVFPGEEDFGIVPVEAMASGRPVIAWRKGGATETVVEGVTGLFFAEQTVDALVEAVRRFESMSFDPQRIVAHARQFSVERFRRDFGDFVAGKLADRAERASDPHAPFGVGSTAFGAARTKRLRGEDTQMPDLAS